MSKAAAYIGLAMSVAVACLLVHHFHGEQESNERNSDASQFSDVRVSDGATLRVKGGQLEVEYGDHQPGSGHRELEYSHGAGKAAGMVVPLASLCACTFVLAVIVLALVDHCRYLARRVDSCSTGSPFVHD